MIQGAIPLPAITLRIPSFLSSLEGWRRSLTAILLGAISVAAQPPLHVLPALIIGFTGLAWLLDSCARPGRAFHDGWMFGTGYFAASLYWVSGAFLVEADQYGWMIAPAILALSLGFGLFGGAATLLVRSFWTYSTMRSCLLATGWTLFEWMRGVVLTGFPWNPIGNVWVFVEPVLQSASWIGVYGLTFLTVYAAASFAHLAWRGPCKWQPLALAACLMLLLAGAGTIRMSGTQDRYVDGVRLRIVQPHIPQREKWRADKQAANLRILQTLSSKRSDQPVTHLIWPESAMTIPTPVDAADRPLLRDVVPPGGLLVTGSIRVAVTNARITRAWNSLLVIDDAGRIAGTYDKSHLVPFGEYVPFRSLIPIDKITEGVVDFSEGNGPVTLTYPGLPPFSPLICYETIFPGAVTDPDNRPGWLLNITNDGWFGTSSGPYQHFASARMRAVEEGLPMVRAANTGISAIVDPFGRVLQHIALGESGYIDAPLPRATNAPTVFALFGNPLALVPFIVVAGCLAVINRYAGGRMTGTAADLSRSDKM